MASALSYASISPKFALYHQNASNAAAHVATLALGLLGVAGLIIRGAVALSKDPTGRHARARALAAGAWAAYALAIAVLDVSVKPRRAPRLLRRCPGTWPSARRVFVLRSRWRPRAWTTVTLYRR